MPTHRHSLDVSINLSHIHCIDEGDGPGLAEPYLWTLFFKVDGSTFRLAIVPTPESPFSVKLQGMLTVSRRNGEHRNLRNTDDDPVDEGEDVAIPPGIGKWDTFLTPIPPADAFVEDLLKKGEMVDLPGTIGVICILMEEDNLPDSSAAAGYNSFCSTFEAKMNEHLNSLTLGDLQNSTTPEGKEKDEVFQKELKKAITNAVESAIKDDLNILEAAWNFLAGADQTLGSGSFQFDNDDLEKHQQFALKARWKEGVNIGGEASPLIFVSVKNFANQFFVKGPGNFIESGGEWEIYGNVSAEPSPPPTGDFGPIITFPEGEMAMRDFTHRAEVASREGFVGGFPNFHTATYGRSNVGGTIFLKPGCATWRDVPLKELGNPALNDFVGRFRATNLYAKDKGFVGGFPNFFHAEKLLATSSQVYNVFGHNNSLERTVVCGTVLIKPGCGEWRDVPLSELGNPLLSSIGARFRATQDYAREHGFIGGFPDFFHTGDGNSIVCGTVLLTQAAAEWRDVLLWLGPA